MPGQALNAMLLACAGAANGEAVASLQHVMQLGAVPDTWAPDGSSVRYFSLDRLIAAGR